MNLKKRLRHLSDLNVRDKRAEVEDTKRVTIINAAKNSGGLLITSSLHEAKTLERAFGVTARSMDINLEGFSGPFFFDPQAIEDILVRAANKIEALENELKQLRTPESAQIHPDELEGLNGFED